MASLDALPSLPVRLPASRDVPGPERPPLLPPAPLLSEPPPLKGPPPPLLLRRLSRKG